MTYSAIMTTTTVMIILIVMVTIITTRCRVACGDQVKEYERAEHMAHVRKRRKSHTVSEGRRQLVRLRVRW